MAGAVLAAGIVAGAALGGVHLPGDPCAPRSGALADADVRELSQRIVYKTRGDLRLVCSIHGVWSDPAMAFMSVPAGFSALSKDAFGPSSGVCCGLGTDRPLWRD